MGQKKTWTIYIVYVFRGIGESLCNLKRANVHAERRERSTIVLDYVSFNSPIVGKQESKVDVQSYVLRMLSMS